MGNLKQQQQQQQRQKQQQRDEDAVPLHIGVTLMLLSNVTRHKAAIDAVFSPQLPVPGSRMHHLHTHGLTSSCCWCFCCNNRLLLLSLMLLLLLLFVWMYLRVACGTLLVVLLLQIITCCPVCCFFTRPHETPSAHRPGIRGLGDSRSRGFRVKCHSYMLQLLLGCCNLGKTRDTCFIYSHTLLSLVFRVWVVLWVSAEVPIGKSRVYFYCTSCAMLRPTTRQSSSCCAAG